MNFQKSSLSILLATTMYLGITANANANSGPFCLEWVGTCWILKIMVNDQNTVYGREVGCDPFGTAHSSVGGAAVGFNNFSVGYQYVGDDRIYEVRPDQTISIYGNSGDNLANFNNGTWTWRSCPTTDALSAPSSRSDSNPNDSSDVSSRDVSSGSDSNPND